MAHFTYCTSQMIILLHNGKGITNGSSWDNTLLSTTPSQNAFSYASTVEPWQCNVAASIAEDLLHIDINIDIHIDIDT